MELLSEEEMRSIVGQCGSSVKYPVRWNIREYSDSIVGYLGEHLSLIVENEPKSLKFFIKCLPRFDEWKANYIRKTTFFNKEYMMLSKLFRKFRDSKGLKMWRPKSFLVKQELFVFEDVRDLGYATPSNLCALSGDEMRATIAALARFHAQSFIYEEEQSTILDRPYTIWEDYAESLSEPAAGRTWRDAGMGAAIDFLKAYSQFNSTHNFAKLIDEKIPELFTRAHSLMKPSSKYRNTVIHRDVWSNNIFLKRSDDGNTHALLVDYQTVMYAPPALDLSSFMYFNTGKDFRLKNTTVMIDYYYDVLSEELESENIDIAAIMPKSTFIESYAESLVFGMTQAALIVPATALTADKRLEIFQNPGNWAKIIEVSRSKELIEFAEVNENYRNRVIELLDDFVETFCISE